jgi:histidinol-phosphate phosphatase family protein
MRKYTVLILCGGRGTRSKNPKIAKSMQLIGGVPIIEWQVNALKATGIDDFILCTGYLGEQIEDWANQFNWDETNFTIIQDNELMGTSSAVNQIRNSCKLQYTVIVMGDVFFYEDLIKEFLEVSVDYKVFPFVHPNDHPFSSDLLFNNYDGKSVFIAKNSINADSHFSNSCLAGITLVETNHLMQHNFIDKDFEKSLIANGINDNHVWPIHTLKYLKDSGTEKSLHEIERKYSRGELSAGNVKAILIDLDDTLVPDSILDKQEAKSSFYPDALRFLKRMNMSDIKVIVVTNQPALAKGQLTQEQLSRYIQTCEFTLGEQGIYWDLFLFCPHHPDKGFDGEIPELKIPCTCRKPDTGLMSGYFENSAKEFEILGMVGDSSTDQEFAKKLGVRFLHICRTALCHLGTGTHECFTTLELVEPKI